MVESINVELVKLNNREWLVKKDGKNLKCSCGRDVLAVLEDDNYTRNLNSCGRTQICQKQ